MEPSRRKFVTAGAGIVALSALAGCSDDVGNGNGTGNGDDAGSDPEPEPEPEPDTAVVSILAENLAGGHDHDHDDHHDDDHHDDDHHDDDHHDDDHHDDDHHDDDHHDDHHDDDELVSQAIIDEACGHMEFDEPESLTGGSAADEATMFDATHQPFDVSIEGDSAFVSFDAEAYSGHDHDHDHDDDHHDDDHHDDDHHDDDHHDDDHHDDDHHDDDHHDDDHHDDDNGMFGFFAHGGEITVHEGELHAESDDVGCSDVDRYVAVEPDHGVVTLELTPDA